MEAPVAVVENDEHQVEESSGEKISSPSSSASQIADPVVYKLVRVEGDGRLVPATDDEVMEVEDLLEDDKGELSLVAYTGETEGPMSTEGICPERANMEGLKGFAQSENREVDEEKLNARVEYIEVMLQKVKQEERLRLSCASPDKSSDYMNVDGQYPVQYDKLTTCDEKLHSEIPLQETLPSPPSRENNCLSDEAGIVKTCAKPSNETINNVSAISTISTGLKPDFSIMKGEICLDNLTIRELHETFKATFGRETSVKDKLWLKRRIAMGLTNSCDVSTTTFIIKDKTLVKKVKEESGKGADGELWKDQIVLTDNSKESPARTTNQIEDRQLVSGKRLKKPKVEYDCKIDDIHTEQSAAKRVRKPTKRYIEELSEVDARECSGTLVSSVQNSGHGHTSPNSCVRPVSNVRSDGTAFVTRQDSLGGSGVLVPYVYRIRRGRPRQNFMALMKFHPSGMGMAAKLVKKALGVRVSRSDTDSANKIWKSGSTPKRIQQPFVAETEKEKRLVLTCTVEQQKDVDQENLDSSGGNSDDNIPTVPTAKGGIRRKHHRAWTLCEVMKLIEGVSRYGAGRWSEIKRVAFASQTYRTSVDLKDKWRNLLRASFAQSPADKGMRNSRKNVSIPIPAPILLRVRELAEMHAQATHDLSSNKLDSRSGRSLHETSLPLEIQGCGDMH